MLHPGIARMKALARSYVWWPGIDNEIEQWVTNCNGCQQHKDSPPTAPPRIWNWSPRPWSRIHIDFAGPFQGKIYLLVVDSHSKWLEAEPVSSTDSRQVIYCLARLLATHGLPDVLVSDNGPSFESKHFRTFCSANKIEFLRIAPYLPPGLKRPGRKTTPCDEAGTVSHGARQMGNSAQPLFTKL
ncbi:hypothetical protein M514_13433 [Trichuris suis]|uniref:RNA-directed DNA polymerase n=1 Tax=Trichuris suis TaxID=68888 RepID=A0A085MW89_9BILA|nr:hypothetical protein M513_13433 [Trichuris suis]KFD61485.1 hypothetical protein M514_13433 [Trichuris suis]